jgi:acetoin utilization deacetylase AcuC-like enzyme
MTSPAAHLKHGIGRVVILDIDLHHGMYVFATSLCGLGTLSTGNGTQSIVWQINEEAYRSKLAAEAGAPPKSSLQVYYGSVHDILSFPCEVARRFVDLKAETNNIAGWQAGNASGSICLDPWSSWPVHRERPL